MVLLMMTICINSCTTINSDNVHPLNYCPSLVIYSHIEEESAVKQLRILPAKNILKKMMKDYFVLRQQIRACLAIS